MPRVEVSKSDRAGKKYKIVLVYDDEGTKTIHIGSAEHSDYTEHKDPERKSRYIARHKAREDWTKSGIATAGYWAKHLLWNQPSLSASIKDIGTRHNLKIERK
jgi:hypothetical protein